MPEITAENGTEHSTNERAERLLGRRDEHGPVGLVLFAPVEMGYACPIHKQSIDKDPDSLHWSEYNSFLWCEHCNRDYPSALCAVDPEHAIRVYLSSVEDAVRRSAANTAAA